MASTDTRSLPGKRGSCWTPAAGHRDYAALDASVHAETVVVGAGIVGLTAALRLCEGGRSVIVLEALKVGEQVTGRSTAKITTQHGLVYDGLIRLRGFEAAQSYAHANLAGFRQVLGWVREHGIDCDLESKDAYAYTIDPARRGEIEAEAEAARRVSLVADVVDRAPLPFRTSAALRFPDQGQFNPAKYLAGLARAVEQRGGRIFEHSRVTFVGEASRWRAVTDSGAVHAEHIFVATNMTIRSPVGMAKRTQPRCHVAMAFRIEDPKLVDGMFIGIDEPTHSIRTGRDADGPLLVVLGPKFNTGQDGNVARRFVELEDWVRTNFVVGEVAWRWCNEDYDTPDRVAYAGTPDPEKSPGFHIATGFNGWGISNGTAAGMLIADLVCGQHNSWQRLYDPARPYPEGFHKDADSQSIVDSVDQIGRGEGGVIVRAGEKLAVWRDEAGELHAVSATCTHKGCTVTWNNADHTWDCPCHGSIFAADGSVIHGPARKALAPAEV